MNVKQISLLLFNYYYWYKININIQKQQIWTKNSTTGCFINLAFLLCKQESYSKMGPNQPKRQAQLIQKPSAVDQWELHRR